MYTPLAQSLGFRDAQRLVSPPAHTVRASESNHYHKPSFRFNHLRLARAISKKRPYRFLKHFYSPRLVHSIVLSRQFSHFFPPDVTKIGPTIHSLMPFAPPLNFQTKITGKHKICYNLQCFLFTKWPHFVTCFDWKSRPGTKASLELSHKGKDSANTVDIAA